MKKFKLSTKDSINNINREQYHKLWSSDPNRTIFNSWEYLYALEKSVCIGGKTGWSIKFFQLTDRNDNVILLAPAYLKDHSFGEYVFDWSWAEAYHRLGTEYYPKILLASPFSPIEGARLLGSDKAESISTFKRLIEDWCFEGRYSSIHVLFCDQMEKRELSDTAWLTRKTVQFHWQNKDYRSFDQFMTSLQQKKRKKIRSEREKIKNLGIKCKSYRGSEISENLIVFFYQCYCKTYFDHGNPPYLNLDFFLLLLDQVSNSMVLIIAYLNEETPIASSLSFVEVIDGKITKLYGRYWGALNNISNLHFEVAYYALIEWCIKHGVQTFEGGAQGEHKLARGFEPIITHSIHWISNSRFRTPIRSFLNNEDQYIDSYLETLKLRTPFKNEF